MSDAVGAPPPGKYNYSWGDDNFFGTTDDVNHLWGQYEVQNGGTAAVTNTYPDGPDGGSLQFTGTGTTSKGGVSFYPGPNNTTPAPAGTPPPFPLSPGPGFGQLKDLTAASYHWFSPAGQTAAPLMRLQLSSGPYDGSNHIATLAYLPHNEAGFVNGAWTAANVLAGAAVVQTSTNLAGITACGARFVPDTFNSYRTGAKLTTCGDLYVFSVEIGFGNGYPANFDGAADNVVVTGSFTPAAGPVQIITLSDQFGVLPRGNSVPALGLGGLLGLSAALAGYGALRVRRRRTG